MPAVLSGMCVREEIQRQSGDQKTDSSRGRGDQREQQIEKRQASGV